MLNGLYANLGSMSIHIGKKIRNIRERLKLGRAEFCVKTGIPKQTLIKYEQESSKPGSDVLIAITDNWPEYATYLLTDEVVEQRNPEGEVIDEILLKNEKPYWAEAGLVFKEYAEEQETYFEIVDLLAGLFANLLKWKYQPKKKSKSLKITIEALKECIQTRLKEKPILEDYIESDEWIKCIWKESKIITNTEMGIKLNETSEEYPWNMEDVLEKDWLPK